MAPDNEKRKRYDRQLRLWGEHGQAAMEDCSVCLLNGTGAGTEALKNLVLPGIGSFTVVDGAVVTEADLGNNFFVEQRDLRTSRAACVTRLLQELNEHVSGAFVAEDIAQVLSSRPDFLHSFGLVIATQLPSRELCEVARICADRSIPLIALHVHGFFGYLRLALPEHVVVESHPAHAMLDLRVLAPPAELRSLVADRFASLAALPDAEFSHVPYVVLLLHAVEEWSAAHAGAHPSSYAQKKEVRALLETYRRPHLLSDTNIEEALAAANTALSRPEPSRALSSLLASARGRLSGLAAEVHAATARGEEAPAGQRTLLSFWLMAASLQAYVAGEGGGLLPASGALPDMTADTATYVQLQELYARQARADVAAVAAHAAHIASLESLPSDLAPLAELTRFCKNAPHLAVLRFRSLEEEYAADAPVAAELTRALAADDPSCAILYILLRASQAFAAQRGHAPGFADADVESDMPALRLCVAEQLKRLGLNGERPCPVSDDWVAEYCRWGGAETHNIASVLGGVAAQEAIKAVTRQYVPLNNTFLFNGSNGVTAVYEL